MGFSVDDPWLLPWNNDSDIIFYSIDVPERVESIKVTLPKVRLR